MEIVVEVGVAPDPRHSSAVGSAPVAAEPTAVEAEVEAEEALGPRGLSWPEAVEEGLGKAASKEAVTVLVLGSSLAAAAAEP